MLFKAGLHCMPKLIPRHFGVCWWKEGSKEVCAVGRTAEYGFQSNFPFLKYKIGFYYKSLGLLLITVKKDLPQQKLCTVFFPFESPK